jgi:class 3 adenylate cyclase
VVVSAGTRRLLGRQFELFALEPRRLAGFATAISAYRVLGTRATEGRFEALSGLHPTPLARKIHQLAAGAT